MKAVMTEATIPVYAEPKPETLSITSLKRGDEVETGKVIRKKKDSWVEVTLPGGQIGYISGQTKIFVIRQVQLMVETELVDAALDAHNVIKSLPKGTLITAIGVEKDGNNTWFRARDESGAEGYITSRAKYKMYQEATVGGGKKLIITGGVFAVMGIVFLVMSFSQETSSSSLFLVIGLIGLGVVQMVQGYLQYRKAKNKKN